jgi:hypothetical protein
MHSPCTVPTCSPGGELLVATAARCCTWPDQAADSETCGNKMRHTRDSSGNACRCACSWDPCLVKPAGNNGKVSSKPQVRCPGTSQQHRPLGGSVSSNGSTPLYLVWPGSWLWNLRQCGSMKDGGVRQRACRCKRKPVVQSPGIANARAPSSIRGMHKALVQRPQAQLALHSWQRLQHTAVFGLARQLALQPVQ